MSSPVVLPVRAAAAGTVVFGVERAAMATEVATEILGAEHGGRREVKKVRVSGLVRVLAKCWKRLEPFGCCC